MKISRNKDKAISIRLESELYDFLQETADKAACSVSELIRIILMQVYIQSNENKQNNQ